MDTAMNADVEMDMAMEAMDIDEPVMNLNAPQFGTYILPQEILDIINEYITGRQAHKLDDPANFSVLVPSHVCLVNRKWNAIFTPILYEHFQFHGDINKVNSLWNFVRTVSHCPNLAAHVKELTLTTWDIYKEINPPDMEEFFTVLNPISQLGTGPRTIAKYHYRQDYIDHAGNFKPHAKRMMAKAFATQLYRNNRHWIDPLAQQVFTNVARVARSVLEDGNIRAHQGNAYQSPLGALLMVLSPNLIRFNCDMWGTDQDTCFDRAMDIATGKSRPETFQGRRPMSKLEVLRLGARQFNLDPDGIDRGNIIRDELMIFTDRNFWDLPQIKDVVILNANMYAKLAVQAQSTLENLTLNGDFSYRQLPSFFSVVPNLRQVSLKFSMPWSEPEREQTLDGPGVFAWIWGMLGYLKGQLEYLDIYQDLLPYIQENISTKDYVGDQVEPFCSPLSEFSKLQHLTIPLMGLYGYNCDHKQGQRLRSHLPPNLVSLGLYIDPGLWTRRYFPMLDVELEGIPLAGCADQEGNLRLRSIICDQHGGTLPIEKMRAAAARKGIFFSTQGPKYMFYAGNKTRWGRMNHPGKRECWEEDEAATDPGRVIPFGMEIHGIKGRG
ncbi:hypothetical protein BJX99DRAFT_257691 [Aspergillus californicus]